MVDLRKFGVAFLLSSFLMLGLIFSDHNTFVKASPAIIIVDPAGGGDFRKIQEAIDNASSGDTIFVRNGTYHEHIVVNKTLNLCGENQLSTVVDGDFYGNVIIINASYVNVSRFTVRNSGTLDNGIYVDRAIYSNISQNTILNTNGIGLYYGSLNVISYNNVTINNFNGIYLLSSSNNVISNNNISSNFYAILLQSSGNNIISGNTMYANFYGMYVDRSSDNLIYHNNLDNPTNVWILQSGIANVWDYGDEGNYWSGYAVNDLNGDGIGDVPFIIDDQNVDRHPLMAAFLSFDVVFRDASYSVEIVSNSTISGFKFEIGLETGNRIIRFIVSNGNATRGFCRITIPTGLLPSVHIVLTDSAEIVPKNLNISVERRIGFYFTYMNNHQTVKLIYSEALQLYAELYNSYVKLQSDFIALNNTYADLMENYALLANNLTQAQAYLEALNQSYVELSSASMSLNETYTELLTNYMAVLNNYDRLQQSLSELNSSYQILSALNATDYLLLSNYQQLLNNYNQLLFDNTQLQGGFNQLNSTYQEYLHNYSEQTQNVRNLIYVVASTTAIFIVITVYLSKKAHSRK